jgi:DNA polymerase-3 subunit gamma/tau
MAGYLVLARKYRSTTFDEVVGQEPIAQTLVNAIKTGRVHHAYLFTGTRGVGKTTMARILAKALNCMSVDEPTPEPCGECEACTAIGRGDDVDVVEIDGASNRGIDEIRELRANAVFRPARCRYKIYYIDEVHMLTKEAFNALLKTLEEPPEHVKFIFATTEAEKVPATILSRCQRFDFRNIPTRRIADHLESICSNEDVDADDEALFRIARAANGSMRDGLSLLDQLLSAGRSVTGEDVLRVLGTPSDERTLAMADAIADGDTPKVLGELSAMLEGGVGLASIVRALAGAFRNVMVAATCSPDSELIELPDASRAQVAELTKKTSMPALVQAVAILDTCGRNLRGSSVGRALVEAALVRLTEAGKFTDPASLIERLEALGSGGGATSGPRGQKKKSARPVARRDADASYVSDRGSAKLTDRTPGAGEPRAVPGTAETAERPGRQAQSSPEPADAPGPPTRELTSQEKANIQKDPAVEEVLSLFGGKVVEYPRVAPDLPAGGDEPDENETDSADNE